MTISNNESVFFNKPIKDYKPDDGAIYIDRHVYRLGIDYDDEEQDVVDLLDHFLARIDKSKLDALVISLWADAYEASVQPVLDRLVAERLNLPALRALFIGDITFEQCEMSWIIQGSYKSLLDAFPKLEVLRIRGGSQLEIEPFDHPALRQLVIETGGLPSTVLENLAQSALPALKHLELWLGTDEYGFDGNLDNVTDVLEALDPGRLDYLGLRNSHITDELAQYLATQPWVASLQTLDLSLGTLSDIGAVALINSPHVRQLQRLDISHHYLSNEMLAEIRQLPIEVIAEDQQEAEDDDYRYVAVGE